MDIKQDIAEAEWGTSKAMKMKNANTCRFRNILENQICRIELRITDSSSGMLVMFEDEADKVDRECDGAKNYEAENKYDWNHDSIDNGMRD